MGLMALIVNETTARGEAFLTFCYISVENHARRTILETWNTYLKHLKWFNLSITEEVKWEQLASVELKWNTSPWSTSKYFFIHPQFCDFELNKLKKYFSRRFCVARVLIRILYTWDIWIFCYFTSRVYLF